MSLSIAIVGQYPDGATFFHCWHSHCHGRGWDAYIAPEDATGRKDLVQAFGLIVAGVVGLIGAIVGLIGLHISRRNLQQQREALQQQREIEDQRAQDTALQAFFEQMGDLLTNQDLLLKGPTLKGPTLKGRT